MSRPCADGCGRPGIYSAPGGVLADTCFRRWERAGKPATGAPPPQKGGRKPGSRRHLADTAEAEAAAAYCLAEAARRITREQSRAAAYLAVRGGRDQIAPRRVLERVQDAEAFSVLTGCRGNAEAAVRLLASLTNVISDEEAA